MIINVKLKVGKYLYPVKLDYQGNYIYLSFGFNKGLIAIIKLMEGAKWLGFEEKPRKIWRINNSQRNAFQLDYLQGKNPYSLYDKEPVKHSYTRPLYSHQKDDADFLLTRKRAILAAEMGCVSGKSLVTIKRGGRDHQKDMTLAEFWNEFHYNSQANYHGAGTVAGDKLKFRIKTLNGPKSKYVYVDDVLRHGVKPTITLLLLSGKTLTVTPDHEIGYSFDSFVKAEKFAPGDFIRICNQPNSISFDRIVDITTGSDEVYDVVCVDPLRHFLANSTHVHNCGKTLVGIEVMERSGLLDWWYVGPKSAIKAVEYEFNLWDARLRPTVMTYQGLTKRVKEDCEAPDGIWFDESSRVKTPTAQRSQAAIEIANDVREKDGFVILTSGAPAPKSPLDWFNQCEIACPGFLKEGSYAKFRNTLAVISQEENLFGQAYPKVVAWRDNNVKCDVCGEIHNAINLDYNHEFVPMVNECERLYRRMSGLVSVRFKKDCLDLPEKIYRIIELKPSKSTLDIAKALVAGANTVIKGLILLRELSDGFQYIETESGTKTCSVCNGNKTILNPLVGANLPEDSLPADINLEETVLCDGCGGLGTVKTYSRETKQLDTPKDEALRDLLDEYSEIGRVVIYAGFTGSVDRCVQICQDMKWNYIRVDGRGWHSDIEGDHITNFQKGNCQRLAFIGQPGAAGMGLTLTASPVVIYYSNDFNAESRIQSEDRVHRMGMDLNRACTVVDLLHLQTDYLILENLKKKRELQALTMGDVTASLERNYV